MAQNEWILDVLSDLKAFAVAQSPQAVHNFGIWSMVREGARAEAEENGVISYYVCPLLHVVIDNMRAT